MKMAIKYRTQVPYGGKYSVVDPLTGIRVEGNNVDMVLRRVREERNANGAPMGLGFEDEVESWICASYPAECEDIDPNQPRKRALGISDIVQGTKVMLAHKLAGSPLVEPEEAERRAKICASCPWNVTFHKPCSGLCPELANLIQGVTGSKTTSHDNELKSCSVCGCYTRVAVWLPLDVQCVGVTEEQRNQFQYVSHCWKQCNQ